MKISVIKFNTTIWMMYTVYAAAPALRERTLCGLLLKYWWKSCIKAKVIATEYTPVVMQKPKKILKPGGRERFGSGPKIWRIP